MAFRPIEKDAHDSFWPRQRTSPSKKVRDKIFMRDGYKCVLCGIEDDLTIDHIIPRSKGGSNRQSNLQTMCKWCNQNKGDRLI